jgi:hypothetical protein
VCLLYFLHILGFTENVQKVKQTHIKLALLYAKSDDWVEFCGAYGWIEAEDDANGSRDAKGDEGGDKAEHEGHAQS